MKLTSKEPRRSMRLTVPRAKSAARAKLTSQNLALPWTCNVPAAVRNRTSNHVIFTWPRALAQLHERWMHSTNAWMSYHSSPRYIPHLIARDADTVEDTGTFSTLPTDAA